jgi:dTDP-4-amino-4,6-dideoxy-D-galactose acyltransferase
VLTVAYDHKGPTPDAADSGSATALLSLSSLAWDTEFFGAKLGAIVIDRAPSGSVATRTESLALALRDALEDARSQDYAHLVFRAGAEDLPSVWAAQAAGLRLVDVGLDSTLSVPSEAIQNRPPEVRQARDSDLTELRELAADSFVLSRFSADPFFSEQEVRRFHRQWITNLHRGLAQAVLVHDIGGSPAGFVSCAIAGDEGRIPLIATSAAFRRRGIGATLVQAATHWFTQAGARVVHVKTQAHNYAALALYSRHGFAVSRTELTFSTAFGLEDQTDEG